MSENLQSNASSLPAREQGKLLLLFSILIGGWLRFTPVMHSSFPINDGGMFYTLIDDLLKNGFAIPAATTYNQSGLPFVYPPLGFYLAATLKQFANILPLTTIMWVPPIVVTLCTLAVYKLTHTLTKNPVKAGVTALCYALVPASSAWLLMGGGLTRAFGALFLLLTIDSAYQLFHTQSPKNVRVLKTILWGSLTVLSHPEMTILAIGISLLFLITARDYKNLLNAIKVALGVILLTSPWWLTVIRNNGLDPFLQAPKTGFYDLVWVVQQLGLFKMVVEPHLTVVSLAGVLGLAILLAKKNFIIPLFLLTLYLVSPRNANTVGLIPVSMLAATAILDLMVPALKNLSVPPKILGLLACYLILVAVMGSHGKMIEFSKTQLSSDNQQAMQWVRENTLPTARFWVITGTSSLYVDPVLEWFPALAERQNISTIQGREWVHGEEFFAYAGKIQGVQKCYWLAAGCVEQKQKSLLLVFDYIYLPKQCLGEPDCSGSLAEQVSPLYLALSQEKSDYQIVYQNEGVAIFSMRTKNNKHLNAPTVPAQSDSAVEATVAD